LLADNGARTAGGELVKTFGERPILGVDVAGLMGMSSQVVTDVPMVREGLAAFGKR
jgi:hypothetical protein